MTPSTAYPVMLDLRGRRAVVVGLGPVGRRKAAGLAEAGAVVLGVDPVGWGGRGGIEGVELVAEPYRADHLTLRGRPTLAFSCAPGEVGRRVVLDALRLGIPVNASADPASGDFTLPATARIGPITLGVSTGGASPGLARALVDRASRALGGEVGAFAEGVGALRARALREPDDLGRRREVLATLGDPAWLDRLDREGLDATLRALRRALDRPELANADADADARHLEPTDEGGRIMADPAEEIIVRRASGGDAEALTELALRTFHDTFDPFNRAEDMDAYALIAFHPDIQRAEIVDPSGVTLVAEDARGALVAFAQVRDRAAPDCVTLPRPIELRRFYVDRPWHGRGVARKLMRAVDDEARARGGASTWLGVWEHNHRALAFYRKLGFNKVGRVEFLLGTDRQLDDLMARALPPLGA